MNPASSESHTPMTSPAMVPATDSPTNLNQVTDGMAFNEPLDASALLDAVNANAALADSDDDL